MKRRQQRKNSKLEEVACAAPQVREATDGTNPDSIVLYPAEGLKEMLSRWEGEPDYQELCFKLNLWAALESQGFNNIRLECLPYEGVHGLWRFVMNIGRVERNSLAVETAIRNACAQMGYPLKKHFVTAKIKGRRTVGGFILKPVKMRKGR